MYLTFIQCKTYFEKKELEQLDPIVTGKTYI